MHAEHPTRPVLLAVFAALLVLLVLTAIAAEIQLGMFAVPVALGIAGAKALLIAFFFMHLRYERSGLVRLFAAAGVFVIAIAATLTLADYFSRP